jgi:hypothetical protein
MTDTRNSADNFVIGFDAAATSPLSYSLFDTLPRGRRCAHELPQPDFGVSVSRRVQQEKVDVIIAPLISQVALASLPVANGEVIWHRFNVQTDLLRSQTHFRWERR